MIDIATIGISAIALIISVLSIYGTYRRDKLRDTIKAYTDLQEYLYHYYEYSEGELETFVDDRKTEEYKSLSNSLAQIEIFATGVRKGIYDYKVVFKMAHGYLDGTLRNRMEYMLDMKTRKHTELYENTRWLLERMDSTPIKSE